MLQAIIYSTTLPNGAPGFTVTSYGNGLSYLLRDRAARRELFVQGDDAAEFRDELEASIEARGLNDGVAFVAGEYAHVMLSDEVED